MKPLFYTFLVCLFLLSCEYQEFEPPAITYTSPSNVTGSNSSVNGSESENGTETEFGGSGSTSDTCVTCSLFGQPTEVCEESNGNASMNGLDSGQSFDDYIRTLRLAGISCN